MSYPNNKAVNLFDKSFCVNSLRNIRRCPKCRNEYTLIFGKRPPQLEDLPDLNFRPVLFPCGHNMCENCVLQNRSNLTCPICMRPCEIPAKYLGKKNFNLREIFDLDFHILGENSNMIYFRKYAGEANFCASTYKNQQTMNKALNCNECNIAPAVGSCDKCKVIYCARCFDSVHKYNVLKWHKLIPLNESTTFLKNVVFPGPVQCLKHHIFCKRYCATCQLVCCHLCLKAKHKNHITRTLVEENASNTDRLNCSLDNLHITRENLIRSQKNVRSLENQLDFFATQTFEFIKVYFTEIHSFLQNEERKIIEDFEKCCSDPQRKIREVNFKLNESQQFLNRVCGDFEYFKNQPPDDIYVNDIIQMYNKNVEKMECHVQISKITENPFLFKVLKDVKSQLKKCFTHKYIDPELNINISSLFQKIQINDRNVMKLKNNDSTLTDISEQMGKKNNNKNQLFSQEEKIEEQTNLNNSAKFCKKSNIDYGEETDENLSIKSELFMAPSELEKFDYDLNIARLTHIISPQNFFIQNVDCMKDIRELTQKFVINLINETPETINENEMYMVFNAENNEWHRAKIIKALPNNVYKMFLIDIGVYLEKPAKNIKEMDHHLKSLPFAAICCSLRDLEPTNENWSSDSNNFLVEMTRKQPFFVKFLNTTTKDAHNIDIYISQHQENILMRDAFLYSGLAKEQNIVTSPRTLLTNLIRVARTNQRLSKHKLQIGEMFLIKILHVETPSEFYSMKIDLIDEKVEFLKKFNDYYENHNLDREVVFLPTQNMGCAGLIDGKWHRVCVEDIESPGVVRVRLVDEGNELLLNWRKLKVLVPEFFSKKEYAMKCTLADIEPKQIDCYKWTEDSIKYFKQITSNPTLQLKVVNVNSTNENIVSINVCKNDMVINVAYAMNEQNYCTTTGSNLLPDSENDNIENCEKNSIMSTFLNNINPISKQYRNRKKSVESSLQRTPINIVHVNDLNEIFFYVSTLDKGVKKFHENIQESSINNNSKHSQITTTWNVADSCLVFIDINKELRNTEVTESFSEWYRGKIVKISENQNNKVLYSVYLRDIGITAELITHEKLRDIDTNLDLVADAVQCCRLACIAPTGGSSKWTSSAIDFIRKCIQNFDTVLATLYEEEEVITSENSKILPIFLWGVDNTIGDALSPDEPKFHCINRILLKIGLAHKIESFNFSKTVDQIFETNIENDEISLREWFNCLKCEQILRELDKQEESRKDVDFDEYCGEYDNCLNELSTNPETLNGKLVPEKWLETHIISKSLFAAYVTYVDDDCIIYLRDAEETNLLKKMNGIILKNYGKPNMCVKGKHVFEVGQGCLVLYHMNKNLYRGIVQSKNEKGVFEIKFIDYGNVEECESWELLPYMPFPNIPAIASQYKLIGIKPKHNKTKYSTPVLDIIHKTIVGKLVSIRVLPSDLDKPIKFCSIRVAGVNLATSLIQEELVDIEKKINKASTENDFDDDDELVECFFELGGKTLDTDSNSGIRYKMKATCDVDSTIDSNNDEIVDYKEHIPKALSISLSDETVPLVKQPYSFAAECENVNHQISLQKESESICDEDEEIEQLEYMFASKYWNSIIEYDFANDTENKQSSNGESNFIDVGHIEFLNEDFSEFKPSDTSTVFSDSAWMSSFKQTRLPSGVTKMKCTVLKVASPTIIYIMPLLIECKLREMELSKRIKYLVPLLPALQIFKPSTFCLACYSKDNNWYRAVINNFNEENQTVKVLYIDYLNWETLSIRHLKKFPKELLNWPIQAHKAQIYGIKPNNKLCENNICEELCNYLENKILTAVIKNPVIVTDEELNRIGSVSTSKEEEEILNVVLYDENDTYFQTPIYNELIRKKVYFDVNHSKLKSKNNKNKQKQNKIK